MKIIKLLPGKEPERIEVENTLEALQKEVEGNIEAVTVSTDLAILCNEEGIWLMMKPNRVIMGHHFVGPLLFVGVDGEEFCSLSEESMEFVEKRLLGEGVTMDTYAAVLGPWGNEADCIFVKAEAEITAKALAQLLGVEAGRVKLISREEYQKAMEEEKEEK